MWFLFRLSFKVLFYLIGITLLLILPWRWIPPPTTSFIVQNWWETRNEKRETHYQWTPWEQISAHVPLAVVAAEDQKFPVHHGFDLESIEEAYLERESRSRGASTISQQVAKNLYLWPGRSWIRKGLEAYLTLALELLWPKRRILEVYVNIAEFGRGVYGVGAASALYYRISPAKLSRQEAARLAAVLPSPRRFSAQNPSPYVLGRAAWIMVQMEQLGGAAYLKDI
jgi:monofunctional biosynthetic peptidoglycan transglycosylase